MSHIIIFTDLDGTLLDHKSYSFDEAGEALVAVKEHQIPLVLASSKTAAEISKLHANLGLGYTPAIVENGAGLFWPTTEKGSSSDTDYLHIRDVVAQLPSYLTDQFKGFGEMTPSQISEITGLTITDAADAAQRCFSEPGLWHGTDNDKATFITLLAEQGIHARQGGRFLTLSKGATKADHMRELTKQLGAQVSIALGDAPNDREMLEAADYGVIIRNDGGAGLPKLIGEDTGRIQRTTQEGPRGWNTAVLGLLETLMSKEKTQ